MIQPIAQEWVPEKNEKSIANSRLKRNEKSISNSRAGDDVARGGGAVDEAEVRAQVEGLLERIVRLPLAPEHCRNPERARRGAHHDRWRADRHVRGPC